MADPDPNTPQVVDPERVVDLTRLLQIRGPLGVLNVLDTIVPVVNMGDVVTRSITVLQPSFRSSDVFSNGILIASAANTVIADTGALPEGVYDIILSGETTEPGSNVFSLRFQHRDSANAANLAVWDYLIDAGASVGQLRSIAFGYEFAVNERLRCINPIAVSAGDAINATIFARRRG